jgi:tRNA-2-methylthio-N6-dimethylallyladenosine synthase
VSGCLAQKDRDLVRRKAPYVDVVLGTHNVHRAGGAARARDDARAVTEIFDEAVLDDHAAFPSGAAGAPGDVVQRLGHDPDRVRQLVRVLHRAAVRGVEVSRPFADVVREVEQLAAAGVTEVTLLGQNVNSYGRDLQLAARQGGDSDARLRPLFGELLGAVGAVEGIRRVRFTSPHPKDMRPETFRAMATTAAACEHLHYPLQSGSDQILAAMHRGYTAERYLTRLGEARATCRTSPCRRTSSSASPARRRTTSRARSRSRRRRSTTTRTRSCSRRGPAPRRRR